MDSIFRREFQTSIFILQCSNLKQNYNFNRFAFKEDLLGLTWSINYLFLKTISGIKLFSAITKFLTLSFSAFPAFLVLEELLTSCLYRWTFPMLIILLNYFPSLQLCKVHLLPEIKCLWQLSSFKDFLISLLTQSIYSHNKSNYGFILGSWGLN